MSDTLLIPPTSSQSNIGSERATRSRGQAGYLYEAPIEDAPPPAYSATYGLVDLNQAGLNTRANVASKMRPVLCTFGVS